MSAYSFLAVLCLVMLIPAVEARLLPPKIDLNKIWKELTASKPVKNDAVKHMIVDEINNLGSPFLLRSQPMGMQVSWKRKYLFEQKISRFVITFIYSALPQKLKTIIIKY